MILCDKIYGNTVENQGIVPVKVGNTYLPYNKIESLYLTNKKEFTIVESNDEKKRMM